MYDRNKIEYVDDYDILNVYNNDNYDDRAILIRHELEKHANIAHMGEVVQSSNSRNIIGTMALDTCFGIVFYDRKNKSGIVGHATPDSKTSTLQEMLNLLNKDEKLIIEYEIVSGYRNEERKDFSGVNELLNYLHGHCPSNVTLIPFQGNLGVQVHEKTYTYEFAFEVNSGLPVSQYLFYDSTLKNIFYK